MKLGPGLPPFCRSLLVVTSLLLLSSAVLRSFQGMATSTRPARSANIQTALPPIKVDFRDVAAESGLTAVHVSGGANGKQYILETTGSGVAIFDADNDGLMDIFVVNGTTLDGKGEGATATSHLYRNLGNLHFEDVTVKSGLGRTGWGQGVCAGDYDN